MSKQVGDFVISRMGEWGITRIFGFPGDGINGLLGALNRASDQMEFIQVRHEEMASFMACAHAKFTGEVGVCMATSGPGAVHLLNGLYDAKMDHQPVVAIVGQQARASLGSDYHQEIDLISLFKDVAHEYVHMIIDPAQAKHVIDRAIRIAKAKRSVTCVIIPNDVQELDDVEEPPREHGSTHSGAGHARLHVVPPPTELEKAAAILNEGKKVAILVGAGALNATEEVKEIAELLGAGVAKALLGKAALSDELPYVTGSIGFLGTNASWDLMTECDTLLMIGSSFPYTEFLPKVGQARGVQIDIDERMLSLRYPMELNLIGDSRDTLRALIPLINRKEDRSWRERVEGTIRDWWKAVEAKAMNDADPINPQRVFWELSSRLPDRCILTTDSGSATVWYARFIKIREGMMASLSGNLATMCPGVPYAIAAKFAYPDRVSIAMVGDGAMQMLGINGLITIAKYWRQWSDPRLVILVVNNRDLNMVTWEQRLLSGDPKFEASQDIPDFNYAQYAEMLGLKGIRVEDPAKIGDAWDQVLAADRPAVLDVVTDPNVPIIPPHLSMKHIKNFSMALAKGDPEESGIIRQSLKDMLKEYLPG
ncbi:thiamine pyrophosphate-requiring protein [Telluribacter sp. SYSU D00476]|uniref:thiamine pyrophosphate-requiring protein n=1 Tax=Telluribacter sp. SYSU D00476 TaxID=2811430 RepID=UPI001FF2FA15|nr:thiamine pyrophosphate-requiring protein [Telluribacter sp. SYSU D00476]